MLEYKYPDGTLCVESRVDGWYWKWKNLDWRGPCESEAKVWDEFQNLDTKTDMFECLKTRIT